MGAWGTSIFSDDNAADLREDYRDLIGNGLSGSEATDRLIEEWQPDGNDGYFVATFWLALALTQWKCGRLEERVKARALAAILDGSAIEPWREGKTEKKRRAVLDKVQAQLQSPQPALTKIKRVLRLRTAAMFSGVMNISLLMSFPRQLHTTGTPKISPSTVAR